MIPVYTLQRKIKIDNLVLEFPIRYRLNPYVEVLITIEDPT
jgi:hypothetical protein